MGAVFSFTCNMPYKSVTLLTPTNTPPLPNHSREVYIYAISVSIDHAAATTV